MSMVETLTNVVKEELDELANTIYGELRAACPSDSGKARASIHIEAPSEHTRFVGARAYFPPSGDDGGTHLYYADQGNRPNASDGRIHPTRSQALRLKDGSFRKSVSTYGGKHFIAEVASRHR